MTVQEVEDFAKTYPLVAVVFGFPSPGTTSLISRVQDIGIPYKWVNMGTSDGAQTAIHYSLTIIPSLAIFRNGMLGSLKPLSALPPLNEELHV